MADNACVQNNDVWAILAYIGGFMLAIGPMYQTYKMYQKKQTKNVSMKWSINYLVGLILVTIYSIIGKLWPIVIGQIIELTNMFILSGYKIHLEKKIFCFDWGGKPEVLELNLNEFKKVVLTDTITLSIEHEDLDNMLEKSNDEDNIFLLKFTRKDLEEMIKKMDSLPQDQHSLITDFKDIHRQLHDSDVESIETMEGVIIDEKKQDNT